MNLPALPGAPRPSLDRTDDPESRKPTLNSGFS